MKKAKAGGLVDVEKRVVKSLLAEGRRNQDIQALINLGRKATVNSARITNVKQDKNQKEASEFELAEFFAHKRGFDARTGLNAYDDERLVRAREAMLLAVGSFNNPTLKFKTEVFAVLSQIAWTYLLQEHLDRNGVELVKENNLALTLQEMLACKHCDLSEAVKANLLDTKKARDQVEHEMLGLADQLLFPMFQANCLNFNNALTEWFGPKVAIEEELSFSLQFSKPTIEHLATLAGQSIGSKGWLAFNSSLGRVDKRDSPGAVIVIQAGICNGDQRGTKPDVERRVGVL